MVYRAVDVVFQYLKPLIVLLVLIPLVVGGFAFAFFRADTVTTRVWADRPVITPDFSSDLYSSSDSPAQIESALVLELLGTDSFSTSVEKVLNPDFDTWSASSQMAAIAELRSATSVGPQGEHLFVISYVSKQPAYGIRVLNAIIQSFGVAVAEIETTQVSAATGTLQANLELAQQSMNRAISAVQAYQAQHRLSWQDAQRDPNYNTLLGQARLQTDIYLNLFAQVDAAQASERALPSVQKSMFHVVDQPAVAPVPLLSTGTPGVRQAAVALGIVALIEALLVYVVARRDPTIRSGEDIRRAMGLKPLGSVPLLGSE